MSTARDCSANTTSSRMSHLRYAERVPRSSSSYIQGIRAVHASCAYSAWALEARVLWKMISFTPSLRAQRGHSLTTGSERTLTGSAYSCSRRQYRRARLGMVQARLPRHQLQQQNQRQLRHHGILLWRCVSRSGGKSATASICSTMLP